MSGLTINNMESADSYEIYKRGSKKYIHILGYAYCAGDSCTDNPDEIYRDVEYCGFELPLADYLADGFSYSDASSEVTQYIGDMTEQDAVDYLEGMTSNRNRVDLDRLTVDIPCGDYYGFISK